MRIAFHQEEKMKGGALLGRWCTPPLILQLNASTVCNTLDAFSSIGNLSSGLACRAMQAGHIIIMICTDACISGVDHETKSFIVGGFALPRCTAFL
jgi:hypothetical protein